MRKTDAKTLKSCLPQWLREHGLPLHKPFACLNPAHQDAHPSMGYNEKNQTVHCFACGATYDIFDLVGQEENLTDFPSKMKAVNRRYGGGEVIRVTAKPTRFFLIRKEWADPTPTLPGAACPMKRYGGLGWWSRMGMRCCRSLWTGSAAAFAAAPLTRLLNRATRTAAGRCSCGTVRLWNVRQGKHCL